ncbi:polysaccharide biosynthesis protein [Alphaproteobacteria bacterium]|nr:polysaccharide biosynthesis protein [Alphaproteobacteria bacterium]
MLFGSSAQWSRPKKKVVLQASDLLIFIVFISVNVHFFGDLYVDFGSPTVANGFIALVSVCNLLTLRYFDVYSRVLSYGGLELLNQMIAAVSAATALLFALMILFFPAAEPSLLLFSQIESGLAAILVRYGFFFLVRINDRDREKVVIFGAGQAGRSLLGALDMSSKFLPCLFADHASEKIGTYIRGVRVVDPETLNTQISKKGIKHVFFAIQNIEPLRRKKIIDRLSRMGVNVVQVPTLESIVLNTPLDFGLNNLDFDSMLERKPNLEDTVFLEESMKASTILVTGAGGSIGTALCKELARYSPKEIIMLDQSEIGLFEAYSDLEEVICGLNTETTLTICLADLCFPSGYNHLFEGRNIDFVFHAAAYKHVNMLQQNVIVGTYNNIVACQNMINVAGAHSVKNFVTISTDKAVRPTNVMGATKKLCELMTLAASHSYADTVFTVVRFGNVLGSSGSVLPIFSKQLRNGGPLTVTDRNAVRYVMLISEAVHLVVKATALTDSDGRIFVLEMGKQQSILEMAKNLIRVHGMEPVVDPDPERQLAENEIGIVFTGLRDGEKLSEELSYSTMKRKTRFEKIYSDESPYVDPKIVSNLVEDLRKACLDMDEDAVLQTLYAEDIGLVASGNIADKASNR